MTPRTPLRPRPPLRRECQRWHGEKHVKVCQNVPRRANRSGRPTTNATLAPARERRRPSRTGMAREKHSPTCQIVPRRATRPRGSRGTRGKRGKTVSGEEPIRRSCLKHGGKRPKRTDLASAINQRLQSIKGSINQRLQEPIPDRRQQVRLRETHPLARASCLYFALLCLEESSRSCAPHDERGNAAMSGRAGRA